MHNKIEPKFNTHKIFIIEPDPSQGNKKKNVTQYYVPTYVRFYLNTIPQIDIQNSNCIAFGKLFISIKIQNLKIQFIKAILQKFSISINGMKQVKMDDKDNYCQKTITDRFIHFQYNDSFPLDINNEKVFWTPFECLDCNLNISIRSVDVQKITVKFNCMDLLFSKEIFKKLDWSEQTNYGQWALAESKLNLQYFSSQPKRGQDKKEQPKKEQQPKKGQEPKKGQQPKKGEHKQKTSQQQKQKKGQIKCFQYIKLTIQIYRISTLSFWTIFFPLLLLSIINLAIFWTSPEFPSRIQAVATLMVAFTQFLSSIRQKIPPNPKITLLDIIIYSSLVNTILCLYQSFVNKSIEPAEYLKTFIWTQSIPYLISMMITGATIVAEFLLFATYLLYWMPSYKLERNPNDINTLEHFKEANWHGANCDNYFTRILKLKGDLIKITELQKK